MGSFGRTGRIAEASIKDNAINNSCNNTITVTLILEIEVVDVCRTASVAPAMSHEKLGSLDRIPRKKI